MSVEKNEPVSPINPDEPDDQAQNYFENFGSDDYTETEQEIHEVTDFPFDEPRTIKLKNGTVHSFTIPTLNQEKRKEGIQRTIIITSPAIVNGQNPRQVKVDFSKSQIAYYQDVIKEVTGYAFDEGDDPTAILDAQKIIREDPIEGTDRFRKVKLASLIPVTHQRAAIGRLYGGKIEIVKPELKEGEKEIVVLNARRYIKVKQEFGIEQNDDGTFTDPENRLFYRFREAGSNDLSKWEVNCFAGHTLNNPKGGSKEERTYDVDACVRLFDSMIDDITGGTVEEVFQGELTRVPIDVKNSEHLAKVPESIKTQLIAFVMNDVTTNSGN